MKKVLIYSHRAQKLVSEFTPVAKSWDIHPLAPLKSLADHLQSTHFDFLLIELTTQHVNIPSELKKIRADYKIPIFILTDSVSWVFVHFIKKINISDVFTIPFNPRVIVEKIERFFEANLIHSKHYQNLIPELIGKSKIMTDLRALICKYSKHDSPVYIYGESGSGKDLVARALHQNSSRNDKPFEILNVCCIPLTIAETMLFGCVEGAFTDAINTPGLFENAHTGTLFLDEITSLDPCLQPKLLRVLEDGEVKRIGENIIRNTEFRLISASNKRIEDAVKDNTFREDLMFRINVLPINVPPLRNHIEDIPLLVASKLKKDIIISNSALEKMQEYHWPGNVRQLFQCIKRAEADIESNTIYPEDINLMY